MKKFFLVLVLMTTALFFSAYSQEPDEEDPEIVDYERKSKSLQTEYWKAKDKDTKVAVLKKFGIPEQKVEELPAESIKGEKLLEVFFIETLSFEEKVRNLQWQYRIVFRISNHPVIYPVRRIYGTNGGHTTVVDSAQLPAWNRAEARLKEAKRWVLEKFGVKNSERAVGYLDKIGIDKWYKAEIFLIETLSFQEKLERLQREWCEAFRIAVETYDVGSWLSRPKKVWRDHLYLRQVSTTDSATLEQWKEQLHYLQHIKNYTLEKYGISNTLEKVKVLEKSSIVEACKLLESYLKEAEEKNNGKLVYRKGRYLPFLPFNYNIVLIIG